MMRELPILENEQAHRLSDIKRGGSGHVMRLNLSTSQAMQLAGLGICEGHLIEVVSTGDPMLVRVCGSTLALGKAIANGVELCVCEGARLRKGAKAIDCGLVGTKPGESGEESLID